MGNGFDDRYAAALASAHKRYQPLIDEIKAATGLESRVWQSGGMTMTLVTPVQGEGDYEGRGYLTLVESFEPDGSLQGTSSWYDHEAAKASGEEYDVEGTPVLEAYRPVGAASSTRIAPASFGRAITPAEWAAQIRAHRAGMPRDQESTER